MEHGGGPAWAAWLEASPLGAAMRESALLYPLANITHVLALIFFAGSILLLDLRLIGFARALPIAATARVLSPIMIVAFLFMVASGTLLFSADTRPLWSNPVVKVKAALIAAGLVNAGLFRLLWNRRLGDWDRRAPVAGRVQAALSFGIWISVALCGRFIGYF